MRIRRASNARPRRSLEASETSLGSGFCLGEDIGALCGWPESPGGGSVCRQCLPWDRQGAECCGRGRGSLGNPNSVSQRHGEGFLE